MSDGENPGGLSPAEQQQMNMLQQMAIEQASKGIAAMICDLNPQIAEAVALHAATRSVQLHQADGDLQRALNDAIADSPMRTERELWGFYLVEAKTNREIPNARIEVRKDLGEVAKKPQELIGYLMVLGAITNPNVRAFLLAHGYDFRLYQRPLSRIVTAG